MSNAQDAINQFFISGNTFYPCPANVSAQAGDADFGISGDCTLSNIKLCTNPLWDNTEGICKTEDTPNAIIIGSIPFSTLRMSEDLALDYWGNRIMYAVTLSQANQTTYNTTAGKIVLLAADDPLDVANGIADGNPDALSQLYDIFLFSTGVNGAGGYSKDCLLYTSDAADE